MEIYDDFDNYMDNETAFNKLPVSLRYFIHSTQCQIVDKVKRKVIEKYGEDGLKSLVKTSGFRSVKTNSHVGGVADSLHIYGCAVDFAKVGIFKDKFVDLCCNLQLIDSGKCWHVQLRRGAN